VKVWDAQTGQQALTLKGHTDAVHSVAFSPDGKRLASASKDETVRVWDARTGQEALTLKGHTHGVTSVAFSPDGKRLASASWDETVRVWDARTGQEALTLEGHTGAVNSVAFSPDGKPLLRVSTNQGGGQPRRRGGRRRLRFYRRAEPQRRMGNARAMPKNVGDVLLRSAVVEREAKSKGRSRETAAFLAPKQPGRQGRMA
jgi:dipeptidyl aminopeptidase/acylaminoacyl peptidase